MRQQPVIPKRNAEHSKEMMPDQHQYNSGPAEEPGQERQQRERMNNDQRAKTNFVQSQWLCCGWFFEA